MRVIPVMAVCLLTTFIGCASASKNMNTAFSGQEFQTRYLDSDARHARRLEAFGERYENPTERHKIQFLLDSVKHSELTFIRNGVSYKSPAAVKWLNRKLYHKRLRENPIRSALDFINRCATKSNTTGKRYFVKWEDGRLYESAAILRYELDALEHFLIQKRLEKVNEEVDSVIEPPSETRPYKAPEIAIPPTPAPAL